MGGEFADLEVERVLDYMLSPDFDGDGGLYSETICRYCGSADVIWVYCSRGWRLINSKTETQHICQRFTSADTSKVKIALDIDAALAARKNNGR